MSAPSHHVERVCAMFDSYCKAVIRNASKNLKRDFASRKKHEAVELGEEQLSLYGCADTYPSEQPKLCAGAFSCLVSNEKLFEAMISIPERQRIVLILDFWYEWSDTRISKYLGVTERTVYNIRQRAFRAIRTSYENGRSRL